MQEVVVYLDKYYSINKSIYVSYGLTKEEIKQKVIKECGVMWYSFDIL